MLIIEQTESNSKEFLERMVEAQDRVVLPKQTGKSTIASVNPTTQLSDQDAQTLLNSSTKTEGNVDLPTLEKQIRDELEKYGDITQETDNTPKNISKSVFDGNQPDIDLSKMEVRGPAPVTGVVVDPKYVGALSQLQFGLSADDDLLLRFALRVVSNSHSFTISAKDSNGEFYLNTLANENYLSSATFSEMIEKLRRK